MRITYLAVGLFRVLDRLLSRIGRNPIAGELEEETWTTPDWEPDATIGPILSRDDAPGLFALLRRLSRRIGCALPAEVRLSYLPACGVLEVPMNEVYTRPVLVVGLPCLQILSRHELKAVLAHELAHLRHEDVRFARDVLTLVDRLRARLNAQRGLVAPWNLQHFCTRVFVATVGRMASSIGRSMEYRADRWSASTYGSAALSAALEKMAVVQPVFTEVMTFADERRSANVYRVFGRAWTALSARGYDALRDKLVEVSRQDRSGLHPPVADRLRRLQKFRPGKQRPFFPCLHLLEDPTLLELVFHNRLYGLHARKSVFRPSRPSTGRRETGFEEASAPGFLGRAHAGFA